MGWLDRLKGKPAKAEVGVDVEQPRPRLPTVKAPPDYWLTPPARPKRGNKTAEEFAADVAAYHAAYRTHIAHNAAIGRKRSMAAGIKSYRWVVGVPDIACEVAKRNSGRVFRYDKQPPEGHVGEGRCERDWCRCVAAPIVHGFDV